MFAVGQTEQWIASATIRTTRRNKFFGEMRKI